MGADWRLTKDGDLGFNVKVLTICSDCESKLRLSQRFFTGYAFVGVILVLISTVFLHSVFRDGLHLHPWGVGQHTQVLKQALPRGQRAGWDLMTTSRDEITNKLHENETCESCWNC